MAYITELQKRIYTEILSREIKLRESAQSYLIDFAKYTMPAYKDTGFHTIYASILDKFVNKEITKLIISAPPQHGKSELSTKRLPAVIIGKRDHVNLAIASYNATKAREFSQDVQRIIADPTYNLIYPDRFLLNTEIAKKLNINNADAKRTLEYFEIFNKYKRIISNCRAVGRGGALTGNIVDTMIMDDLYKDYQEGNSPTIRESIINWYISVVKTRLHNDSQELIVFTRWHEEDLVGYIEKNQEVTVLTHIEQLKDVKKNCWYKINFPAIKTETIQVHNKNMLIDPRASGEVLWADRHSYEKLDEYRKLDVEKFESLYQGDPQPMAGLLADRPFNTYTKLPELLARKNYTDTADTGQDYLCSFCYGVGEDKNIYILDVVYDQNAFEVTEEKVVEMLLLNRIMYMDVESNSGGRAFAMNIDKSTGRRLFIEWFHQSENKEGRILSNKSNVMRHVYFPVNWEGRWPELYKHLTRFKKNFKANTHDDCWDALTGVWEHSGLADDVNLLWN